MDKNNQKIYYDPILSLRVIHPNGSVTEINKDGIPDYNFHYPIYLKENNGYKSDDKFNPLDFYPLYDKYILVVYSTASDWTDNETFVDRGMIIDWNGNKISEIEFGKSYIDHDPKGSLMPNQAMFAVNSDRTKGFLRFSQLRKSSDAEWKQYSVYVALFLKQ
ncbi:3385_t:CDS:2, partial [Racocetra fulgida]